MARYIGLDVHKHQVQVHGVDSAGNTVLQGRIQPPLPELEEKVVGGFGYPQLRSGLTSWRCRRSEECHNSKWRSERVGINK